MVPLSDGTSWVAATPPTSLTIIGDPVAHSLSPVFQQAALDALGLPLRYKRTRVTAAELPALMALMRQDGMGGNVTMPHKALAASLVDARTSRVHRIGAVNTLWVDSGRLVGHNTDVDGIRATLRALCPDGLSGPAVVIGSGGSAAALLVGLEEFGCPHTVVVARQPNQAGALVARVGTQARVAPLPTTADGWHALFAAIPATALVVNATPVGMQDDQLPIPVDLLPSTDVACFDLVYRPGLTAWIRAARAGGHRAEDGLRMLVEQGAAAFSCWFDRPAPLEAMWAAVGRPDGTL